MLSVLKTLLRVTSCLTIMVPAIAAATPSETVLYRFKGGTDGSVPMGALLMGGGGALYGTTYSGGANGFGTLFRMPPPAGNAAWTHRVIYEFGYGERGYSPTSGVIMDKHGVLYGSTMRGGGSNHGSVYQLAPPAAGQSMWDATELYDFGSLVTGLFPEAALVADANGILYWTTFGSGTNEGDVFSITVRPNSEGELTGTEKTIHQFGIMPNDGDQPRGGVLIGADGALYGTTYGGGHFANNDTWGLIYKFTAPTGGKSGLWDEQILYEFTGGADGGSPAGEVVADKTGALYGTTIQGGTAGFGVVYKLTPPAATGGAWTEKVLYDFKGGADGAYPQTALLRTASGVLYGTTLNGGAAKLGTVFMLKPPTATTPAWTHTVLHSFAGGADGASPEGAVIADVTGALYGSTAAGGSATNCSRGCGTVYKIVP